MQPRTVPNKAGLLFFALSVLEVLFECTSGSVACDGFSRPSVVCLAGRSLACAECDTFVCVECSSVICVEGSRIVCVVYGSAVC